MKRFLLKIVFLLIPVLVLTLPIDLFLSRELKKANEFAQDEFSIWNDLYSGSVDAKVAIYGASRAWVQIDPGIIEKNTGLTAYNLGIDGHNFWLQYYRHKLLFAKNVKPDYIIMSLDLFTLQKNPELYNLEQFLPYMLFDNELKSFLEGYEGYTFLDYYVPLLRYYGKTKAIKYALKSSLNPVIPDSGRIHGYKAKIQEWNEDPNFANGKVGFMKADVDAKSFALFKLFLDECKKSNVKVIFVYTPDYIEGQRFVSNRREILDLYKSIALHNNIPYLDYSGDELCLKKEYFYNTSHLNKKGAELFTTMLVQDIGKYLSRQKIAGQVN
jgi:hypothetical protein